MNSIIRCIDAEMKLNRDSAAYVDCRLSDFSWTIKLRHDVAPCRRTETLVTETCPEESSLQSTANVSSRC